MELAAERVLGVFPPEPVELELAPDLRPLVRLRSMVCISLK